MSDNDTFKSEEEKFLHFQWFLDHLEPDLHFPMTEYTWCRDVCLSSNLSIDNSAFSYISKDGNRFIHRFDQMGKVVKISSDISSKKEILDSLKNELYYLKKLFNGFCEAIVYGPDCLDRSLLCASSFFPDRTELYEQYAAEAHPLSFSELLETRLESGSIMTIYKRSINEQIKAISDNILSMADIEPDCIIAGEKAFDAIKESGQSENIRVVKAPIPWNMACMYNLNESLELPCAPLTRVSVSRNEDSFFASFLWGISAGGLHIKNKDSIACIRSEERRVGKECRL